MIPLQIVDKVTSNEKIRSHFSFFNSERGVIVVVLT